MSAACIIGNGESRLQFNLHSINKVMTTFGCNALYRDFIPDKLVAMDYAIVDEILNHQIYNKTVFHTQHYNKIDKLVTTQNLPISFISQQKETVDSGNTAVRLAAEMGHDQVYLIGFDYISTNRLLNNVYGNTRHYANKAGGHTNSVTLAKWQTRLRAIAKTHSTTNFIRVNGNGYLPLVDQSNFTNISPQEFLQRIEELNAAEI